MNPLPPIFCGTLLFAMIAAGFTHWWSVERLTAFYPPAPAILIESPPELSPLEPRQDPVEPRDTQPIVASRDKPARGDELRVMERMLDEMNFLRGKNQDLTDQIAETNRDLMKMQFTLDTHSESFRPMPASETFRPLQPAPEPGDTSSGFPSEFPGVLPPRASPVYPLE